MSEIEDENHETGAVLRKFSLVICWDRLLRPTLVAVAKEKTHLKMRKKKTKKQEITL